MFFLGGVTMLAMAKASSDFIHVHNTEALCLKNWYSLNAVRFCLFVFSVSQEILKKYWYGIHRHEAVLE